MSAPDSRQGERSTLKEVAVDLLLAFALWLTLGAIGVALIDYGFGR